MEVLTVEDPLGEEFDGGVEVSGQGGQLQVSWTLGSRERGVARPRVVLCYNLDNIFCKLYKYSKIG